MESISHNASHQPQKKASRGKQQQVVGDDGWTRVTSKKYIAHPCPSSDIQQHEAPDGLTQSEVLAKWTDIQKRWKTSESWKSMESTLKTRVIGPDTRIDACVLFGSGTFTGLRQGWINRSRVAMYQLAAFKSVVDLVGKACTFVKALAG